MSRLRRTSTLGAVLALLFLVSLALQTGAGWIVFKAQQQTHGEPGNVLGSSGYLWPWTATLAQIVAFAALAALLALQAGRARAEGEREIRQALRRIEAHLAALSRAEGSPGSERRRPAVEGQHLAGEVVRSGGGEEDGHPPQVTRAPEAAEGDAGHQGGFVAGDHPLREAGREEARS
jgi:hypothetical protein